MMPFGIDSRLCEVEQRLVTTGLTTTSTQPELIHKVLPENTKASSLKEPGLFKGSRIIVESDTGHHISSVSITAF